MRGEVAGRVGQSGVDGGEQRVDLGVLCLHLVQQGEAGGPARCRAANARPQVAILHAVVQQQLGLEVLPARTDPRGVSRAGGPCHGEAAQVAPEGVVGRVHHGEVDRLRRAIGRVLGRHRSFLLVNLRFR